MHYVLEWQSTRYMFVLYKMCETISLWKSAWLCRWGRSYVVRCCLSPRRFWVSRTIAPSVPRSFSWPSLRYPQLSSAFPNLSSLRIFYSHCSRFSCVVRNTVIWVDESFNQSNGVWPTNSNNPRFNRFVASSCIVLLTWISLFILTHFYVHFFLIYFFIPIVCACKQ